ncbi:MAG: NHL repeat-containing protein [Bacteroidetes Order II. Incertae sedis bacterium]|nr:NHL repeat-containing protein [Bacteroidetes Order II. bacterium]
MRKNILLLLWGLLYGGLPVIAQKPDTTISRAMVLTTFRDARALATDNKGNLFVTDVAKNLLFRLNADGKVLAQVGGTGSGDYQFDSPVDVDPTNGLDIYVADYGNRRVQHFSAEFRYLETFPLVFETHTPRQIAGFFSPNADYDNKLILSEGTPVALTVDAAKELFVADQEHAFVAKWDAQKRVQRFFGRYDAGDAALLDPVSMVVAPNGTLFIADRGRGDVMVFDAFGTFLRSFGSEQLAKLRGISLFGDRILVTGEQNLWVYQPDGKQLFNYALKFSEPIVDAVYAHRAVYLLTPTKLMRFRP